MRTTDNGNKTTAIPTQQETALREIEDLDAALQLHFESRTNVQRMLTRPLVSFQANKTRPVYRWYKYKEAFSAALVEHFCQQYDISDGVVLDPFAGSGTALFAASDLGLDAEGIELLPIGQEIVATKRLIDSEITRNDLEVLRRWALLRPWEDSLERADLPELRITAGAYPTQTKEAIEKYVLASSDENPRVQAVLRFALLCVLEAVSYTRKDGQYLRWDHRSGRRQGKKLFAKNEIVSFGEAISDKINEILDDVTNTSPQLDLFAVEARQGEIRLHNGSCLDVMPTLQTDRYSAIITSPPYCNRYDYTRTYALELAMLGVDEQELIQLRQTMLSCTVENRAKDLLSINEKWADAINVADNQVLLQAILKYLDDLRDQGKLNNRGIPRMIRGYFYEMACVILECSRVLRRNAPLLMVNDNVRYAGASISVDMILSEFAEKLGFSVENIHVLPNGKGNSSQQMGRHGREPLRKCVYVWRKQ